MSLTYKVGRLAGRHPIVASVIALAVITLLTVTCSDKQAAVAPSASLPLKAAAPTPPAPPPPAPTAEQARITAAVGKEVERISKLSARDFCASELRKLTLVKGAPNQIWLEALRPRATAEGVTALQLTHIQSREVSIGMPECAVLATWGRPERVNRSTNAQGSNEQWVYSSGNYLYFDSTGRLRSMQTQH